MVVESSKSYHILLKKQNMYVVFNIDLQDGESTSNEQCKATISSVTRTARESEERMLLFLVVGCVLALERADYITNYQPSKPRFKDLIFFLSHFIIIRFHSFQSI